MATRKLHRHDLTMATLLLLLSGTAAQPPSEQIAGLCRNDQTSPHDYINTSFATAVNQTMPRTITVSVNQPNTDAFWLHDDDGELISFAATTASSHTFDIPSQPRVVTAFVHYAAPLCRTAASRMTHTFEGIIDRYVRQHDNYGSVSSWPADRMAASRPVITVDYDARSATISVPVSVNYPVPLVFTRGAAGQLLAFDELAPPTADHTFQQQVQNLPQYNTALTACATLGGEVVCRELSLTAIITQSLRSAHPVAAEAVQLQASLTSMYSLQLQPPADEICGTPPQNYVLWAERVTGEIVGFVHNSPLSVIVGPVASCAYTSTECIVQAYLLCGSTLRAGATNVSALPAPGDGSQPTGNATGHSGAARCEDQHPGRDTSWLDPITGELCECFNGVADCGAAQNNGLYLTSGLAAALAAGCSVIGIVLIFFCCYLRVKHNRAMETPIEGAKRRSILMPGANDYVKSRSGGKVGGEIELPAPPQAGGGEDKAQVVIVRDSVEPRSGGTE